MPEGNDNGPPGLRPHSHANYHAAFVFGPDGRNIEAVCHAQVFDEGQAGCRFIWIADFLPNKLANDAATMMEQGLCVIKQTMEGSRIGT